LSSVLSTMPVNVSDCWCLPLHGGSGQAIALHSRSKSRTAMVADRGVAAGQAAQEHPVRGAEDRTLMPASPMWSVKARAAVAVKAVAAATAA
jgi:hypothetical protein